MANERIPTDPYDPARSGPSDDDLARPTQRFDEDLQADPELAEGPASTGKIALFAVGLALILGAVFYGLNSSSVKDAQTAPPAQTAQTQNPNQPQAPSGLNDEPGKTTGSATGSPNPPQAAPQGTEVDRAKMK